MCNCGNKREGLIQQHSTTTGIISSDTNDIAGEKKQIRFEYIGNTALTVIGNISGKRYRFGSPGEFLYVDLRDVTGLMSIPVLRKALY